MPGPTSKLIRAAGFRTLFHRLTRSACLTSLALCLMTIVSETLAQRLQTRIYSREDGLPSAVVFDIAQDGLGRIWFATQLGIVAYDGRNWESQEVPGATWPTQLAKLATDDEGRVWSLTAQATADSAVLKVTRFGGRDQGLADIPLDRRSDINSQKFLEVIPSESGPRAVVGLAGKGVFMGTEESWIFVGSEEGLTSTSITGIEIHDGRVHVLTRAGISVVEGGSADNHLNGILGEEYLDISGGVSSAPSSGGDPARLWLKGFDWIGYLEQETFTPVASSLPVSSRDSDYYSLVIDAQRGIFYGNAGGLFYHDLAKGSTRRLGLRESGIPGESTAFLVDREENIWVAGLRGVTKIYGRIFANFGEEHGLLENEVSAILETTGGEVVLGHPNGLTIFEEPGRKTLGFEKSDVIVRVMDLTEDARGRLWMAASALGIGRLARLSPSPSRQDIRWYDEDDGVVTPVTSVLVDSKGVLWGATSKVDRSPPDRAPLFRFEEGRFRPATVPLSLSQAGVRRMTESRRGEILMASLNHGLLAYDGRSWKQFLNRENPSANKAYTVLEDSEGRVLVGTLAGLYVTVGDELVPVDLRGDRIDDPVYFLVEDGDGELWIGTDNGVFRWNSETLTHYGLKDGLAGSETNRAAGIVDRHNRVWIGTARGLSRYHRKLEKSSTPPPLVELRSIEVAESILSLDEPHLLNYDQNNPVFRFRAVSFIDENEIRYSSFLEGFDLEWREPYRSEEGVVRYTNLPAGTYRFHLKAENAAGVWSPVVSSATIRVGLPFWNTWWFYALCIVSFGTFVLMAQRYVSKRQYASLLEKRVEERTLEVNRLNADLSRRVRERTAELEAANAELEAFTYSVSHDLRAPLRSIDGFSQAVVEDYGDLLDESGRDHLIRVRGGVERMRLLIDAFLELSRVSRASLVRERIDLSELARAIFQELKQRYPSRSVTTGVEDGLIVQGDKKLLGILLVNLLDNAYKFTTGRPHFRVEVGRVDRAEGTAFYVRDNGVGFDVSQSERLFQPFERLDQHEDYEGTGVGLATVERIVIRHGGRLWVDSRPDEGATFFFTLSGS